MRGASSTPRLMALVALLLLAAAGCEDDGEAPGEDAAADTVAVDTTADDVSPDGEVDTEPPELRDVRAELTSPVKLNLPLNDGPVTRTIPSPGEVIFTVFASDETPADELTVSAQDVAAEAEITEGVSAEFRNGLWRITTPIEPGLSVAIAVTDAAGNTTLTPALTMRSLRDALVGDWEQRFYDTDQTVTTTASLSLADDGTWSESRDGVESTGVWSVDGGTITLELRTRAGEDTDPDTAEEALSNTFYVDETHMGIGVWTRSESSEGDGLAGSWLRNGALLVDDGGTLVEAWTRIDALELTDGGAFSETITTSPSTPEEPTVETRSGTWALVLSDNYAESAGNFLDRSVTQADGVAVEPPVRLFQLHYPNGDHLLINPWIKRQE